MNEPADLPAGGLVRVRLDLGYDGTDFSGWAGQPGRRTVQGVLSEALTRILRLPRPPALVVAGRTDAGVHASGQVCHLDVPAGCWLAPPSRPGSGPDRSPAENLLHRLAGVLPPDIRVHAVGEAPLGFDARFCALHRRYAYRVCDDPAGVPPLRRRDVLGHHRRLDVAAMDASARNLLGRHDFAAFCKRRDGATTIRTLLEYGWARPPAEDGLVVATVVADAFCHSMVRALVGAALAVGDGRHQPGWPAGVLAAGARDPGVSVVPAHGLVLEHVAYPPDADLAGRAREARAVRTLD